MGEVIVLFEVTMKEGRMEDYLNLAEGLKDSLSQAEGFISSERFTSISTEGKLLSMSFWKDEESVMKWRNQAMHRVAQHKGRMKDFADYRITVATALRSYTMTMRSEAPEDSNEYHNV